MSNAHYWGLGLGGLMATGALLYIPCCGAAEQKDPRLEYARTLLHQAPAVKQADMKIDPGLGNSEAFSIRKEARGTTILGGGPAGVLYGVQQWLTSSLVAGGGKARFRASRQRALSDERRQLRLPAHARGIPLVLRPPAVDEVSRLSVRQPFQHDFSVERSSVSEHRVDARVPRRDRSAAGGVGPEPGAIPLVYRPVCQAEHRCAVAFLSDSFAEAAGQGPRDSHTLQRAERVRGPFRAL